jgi:hypothetical protein
VEEELSKKLLEELSEMSEELLSTLAKLVPFKNADLDQLPLQQDAEETFSINVEEELSEELSNKSRKLLRELLEESSK